MASPCISRRVPLLVMRAFPLSNLASILRIVRWRRDAGCLATSTARLGPASADFVGYYYSRLEAAVAVAEAVLGRDDLTVALANYEPALDGEPTPPDVGVGVLDQACVDAAVAHLAASPEECASEMST